MSVNLTKLLVKKILENPLDYKWSLQGLGMLRLYLDDSRRMHIWDSRFVFENVSQMHTHPWNFESLVVAGVIHNQRFVKSLFGEKYFQQSILCGVGGGLEGSRQRVTLSKLNIETYFENEIYHEHANEIHFSAPEDGTVTIVERQFLDDVDHALVFWKDGDWVSAEPRPATIDEISAITTASLDRWF